MVACDYVEFDHLGVKLIAFYARENGENQTRERSAT